MKKIGCFFISVIFLVAGVLVWAGGPPIPQTRILTNATGLPIATGISGLGTGIADALAVNSGTVGAPSLTIAKGTVALGTTQIGSGACTNAIDGGTGTGILTTDVIDWGFNGDPTSTTGYSPTTNGMLTIIAYPTADHAVFKVCNNTDAAITPGAITLNWRVER